MFTHNTGGPLQLGGPTEIVRVEWKTYPSFQVMKMNFQKVMCPLNSRRIKGCWIQRIAEALELPGRVSLEESR